MVEGKVEEPFGILMSAWMKDMKDGKEKRLIFLCNEINISSNSIYNIRYQLIHRTASAVITAKQYHCKSAVVLIHSFSSKNTSYMDFSKFLLLYGLSSSENTLIGSVNLSGIDTYWAWVN